MDRYEQDGIKSFFIKGIIIIAVAVIFLILGGLFALGAISVANNVSPGELLRGQFFSSPSQESDPSPVPEEEQQKLPGLSEKNTAEIPSLQAIDKAISEVAKKVTPSVVNIRVSVKQEDIFGNEYYSEGLGSGVIYTNDGYIITNNHVAGDAEELMVRLADGSEHPAVLVGSDANTDVAVIKIEKDNLPAADFTSIENVEVGEIAIAIGSPFGLEQTVTMGVVSAKGRDISVSSDTLPMVDLIQTDASINQGNSGGPLVNSSGQVIGINTLIFSTSGASAGVGFAIPSDTATNIAGQIIKYGEARIPFIGIEMGANPTDIVGVYVTGVLNGYPAQEAGVRRGDIIVEIAGREVTTTYELLAQILRHNVGETIKIRLYRNGSPMELELTLVEAPSN
ncbi:MAG: trypsin-like peptidase domain-containing protein [Actinomycetota bacterium]|nr:trypsin-like peptidase domain-containing protein [Actinomycetota bacterium]